ncbi:3-oxoacyl-ACP reductase FabG [Wenzhouxiangella limi]|uniref:3-oxoacyl-[acyl-carrier-protein] reductase n=1 Tax=Wenzhouxiangella limi TaxID=2707351 RepID=A0A845UTF8_9GAMM|nr:3-oxoacyl-ACP reductase FabG [Wenzhouxiangella limi]NDY94817.1 3-oxoacyl-ACP reductase FabG [Wenzhouxiangella limi]
MTTSMHEEVVLVTGASRGIGQAVARRLRQDGAAVFGTATSPAGAEAVSAELGDGRGLVLDVTDAGSIDQALATIGQRCGPVTVLVNNAAITRDQLLMRLKDEDWDAVLEANLKGAMRMCRASLRGMLKARRGRIIGISSVVGYAGNPGQTNYAAAKAGLAGFSRALAHEVGSRGITVNVVAPGFIDTDMTRALTPEQRERLQGTIPLGHLGRPEDVAACVSFLAGPDSGYITGQTVHVNGGMYMT